MCKVEYFSVPVVVVTGVASAFTWLDVKNPESALSQQTMASTTAGSWYIMFVDFFFFYW